MKLPAFPLALAAALAAAPIVAAASDYPPAVSANTEPAAAPLAAAHAERIPDPGPLDEIIVTAALQPRPAMRLPGSVSVIGGEALAARQARHFEDVLGAIPNMNFSGGTNRARYFQIRGMGERSQFVDPVNPSVGVLIDNVDFSGAAAIAAMLDVKQVEVLRGPQGTRYGANALAGLINIITNEPTDEFELRAETSLADYNTRYYELATGGTLIGSPGGAGNGSRPPLVIPAQAGIQNSQHAGNSRKAGGSRLLGRLAIGRYESDGYMENGFLGRKDTNGRDELTARGRLLLQVGPDWDFSLTLAHADMDNGYDAFTLDNTRRTLSDSPGYDTQESRYGAFKAEWRRPGWRMEAYLNAAESRIGYGYDEDWTYLGFPEYESTSAYQAAMAADPAAAEPSGYASTDEYLRRRDTASAELRLASAGLDGAAGIDWAAGIYHLRSDEALRRIYTYAPEDFLSDFNFDAYAAFFQWGAALGPRIRVRAGLRGERKETAYADTNGARFRKNYPLWGGRLSLEYQAAGGALLYASAARGYKAGGFNSAGTLPRELRQFEDEQLAQYELGWKGAYAGGRLRLQAAVFRAERDNQQVKTHFPAVREDGSAEFIELFRNAASGEHHGLEISLAWAATERLRATLDAGWLQAEFDEFTFTDSGGERRDLSGRAQAHAPKYTYSLALDYRAGPWRAALSADAKDSYFFSNTHNTKSNNYIVYNASLRYERPHWSITLWARNLGNEDYQVRGFRFGNDPRKGYAPEPYHQFGEPRIAGITLAIGF